jgi:hypothetical protein
MAGAAGQVNAPGSEFQHKQQIRGSGAAIAKVAERTSYLSGCVVKIRSIQD